MSTTWPYVPTLLTAGSAPTAAQLNLLVRFALAWQGRPQAGDQERPQCDIYQTVGQSIANAADTAVLFDSEGLDTGNAHSTSSNTSRWTCPAGQAGWYDVSGTIAYSTNATGYRQAKIRVNGTTLVQSSIVPAVSGTQTNVPVARKIHLNAGDYVELVANHNAGSSLSTSVVSGAQSTLNVTLSRSQ